MIFKLQQVFHSIIKSLEVLYVIEGIKPCARIMVFENETEKAVDFLKQNKIESSISNFKVMKQNLQSEFYSDKSVKIPKDSKQKGYFFIYLSKDKDTAEKAKTSEENNKHKELGLLLGYPKCCCEFFEKNFDESNTDLTLKTLENSNGYEFPFYSNIAARHFDIALLSHFPCKFNCNESIKIAKNNLKIINKYSPQIAAMFSGILQGIVVYTIEEGVFLLRKYEKINDEIIYGDVLTTSKSKLYYLLSSNRELKIADKNTFAVNDVKIEGQKYGAMVFS
ncbi:DUF483 domain-containing protein [Candidatus Woesearchaeota archaeon]|nr:DUF483 domain-containing protein [Candidatus Woesearchaeota archaeon]